MADTRLDTRPTKLSGVRLKAVHRIEGGEGDVKSPGATFRVADEKEAARLLRLGAAVPAEEADTEV
jgi:membrane protein implicated in regulation of membrane protease activity